MLRHGSRRAGSVAALLLTTGLFACGVETETEAEADRRR